MISLVKFSVINKKLAYQTVLFCSYGIIPYEQNKTVWFIGFIKLSWVDRFDVRILPAILP